MVYFIYFIYIYEITGMSNPENLAKCIGYYYQYIDRPQSDMDNNTGTCKNLLRDLYSLYSIVYDLEHDMFRRASISVRLTIFLLLIPNIISSHDNSFTPSSSSCSHVEIDNYFKRH